MYAYVFAVDYKFTYRPLLIWKCDWWVCKSFKCMVFVEIITKSGTCRHFLLSGNCYVFWVWLCPIFWERVPVSLVLCGFYQQMTACSESLIPRSSGLQATDINAAFHYILQPKTEKCKIFDLPLFNISVLCSAIGTKFVWLCISHKGLSAFVWLSLLLSVVLMKVSDKVSDSSRKVKCILSAVSWSYRRDLDVSALHWDFETHHKKIAPCFSTTDCPDLILTRINEELVLHFHNTSHPGRRTHKRIDSYCEGKIQSAAFKVPWFHTKNMLALRID